MNNIVQCSQSKGSAADGHININRFTCLFQFLPYNFCVMLYKLRLVYSFVCWCHLLVNFANSLDPDQAGQNIGPDLDPNSFETLMVFRKEFLKG